MTPTERAEGRLLLEQMRNRPDSNSSYLDDELWRWIDWVNRHADALLADHEEIARAAVREFAESVLDIWPDESVMRDDSEFMRGSVGTVGITRDAIRKLAAARGVTLEKP